MVQMVQVCPSGTRMEVTTHNGTDPRRILKGWTLQKKCIRLMHGNICKHMCFDPLWRFPVCCSPYINHEYINRWSATIVHQWTQKPWVSAGNPTDQKCVRQNINHTYMFIHIHIYYTGMIDIWHKGYYIVNSLTKPLTCSVSINIVIPIRIDSILEYTWYEVLMIFCHCWFTKTPPFSTVWPENGQCFLVSIEIATCLLRRKAHVWLFAA